MSLSVTLSCHQLLFPVSYGSSSLAGHYHQRRAFVFQRSNNATACVLFFSSFFAETARRSFKILIQAKNKQPSCRSTKNKEEKKKTKTKKKTNDL